jgi:hypothetical protein
MVTTAATSTTLNDDEWTTVRVITCCAKRSLEVSDCDSRFGTSRPPRQSEHAQFIPKSHIIH